ncbi:hypothetical protein FB45DRAFT_410263 [Roridomyces roridus]|uniref:Zn(2)-C6 fungal-type domain-containing protein n=1 Tax=Roridomyces roridus TaxID=1738132 RepID=A0AAD7C4K6_9AGAR|nr:hypothetical protein FB45DRAFT_410263 [Roridomyces roridus]
MWQVERPQKRRSRTAVGIYKEPYPVLHHLPKPLTMSDPAATNALLMNRRRRAMIACTNCRKRKIKCVTTEEPPRRPCARCTKRSLCCEYVAVEEDYSSLSSQSQHDASPPSHSSQLSPTAQYAPSPSSSNSYHHQQVPSRYYTTPSSHHAVDPSQYPRAAAYASPVAPGYMQTPSYHTTAHYGSSQGHANVSYDYTQVQYSQVQANQWPQHSSPCGHCGQCSYCRR